MSKCIHCLGKLNNLINLGDIPIVNNFSKKKIIKKLTQKLEFAKTVSYFNIKRL